jgi:hypothetical protein
MIQKYQNFLCRVIRTGPKNPTYTTYFILQSNNNTSRHFKKMHIKKVFVELKRRKQVENLAVFVELKRKKQNCLQFSIHYQETKLFGGYFSHLNEFFYLVYQLKNLVY